MMKPINSLSKFVFLAVIVSMGSGCSTVMSAATSGLMGAASSTSSYQGAESIQLPTPANEKIYDLITEVGKNLGYTEKGRDQVLGFVTLTYQAGALGVATTGRLGNSILTVSAKPGTTRVDVRYILTGHFNTGDKEAANKVFSEFKDALLKQF